MKKIKFLVFLLAVLFGMSQSLLYSQNPYTVSGTVTSVMGQVVPNHLVNIASLDSTLLINTDVYTDVNGFYSAFFTIAPGMMIPFIVTTADNCGQGNMLSQVVMLPSTANFVICDSIINPINCDAFFIYSSLGMLSVDFADMSFASPNASVISWAWDFGDGTSSTTQNPNHVYGVAGQYNVCLSIVTSDTCTSTFCEFVTVVDSINTNNCMAYFTYSSAGSLSVDFADMSFVDPNTTVIDWNWTFGDGTTSANQNPNHVYGSVGQYEVCLSIITSDSCSSSFCEYIVVDTTNTNPQGCQSYFIYNSAGSLAVDFADMSFTSPNTSVISWTWDFGDGTSSTTQNPNHVYGVAGQYNVCLSIVTSDTCTSTFCEFVTVVDSINTNNCMAYFTYSSAGSLAVDFADMSFVDPNTTVIDWNWTFGDGATSANQNPNHVYGALGQYEVCLSIITSDSCSSSFCEYIVVDTTNTNPQGCQSYFIYNSAGSLAVDFADMSFTSPNTSVISWTWDFGDGTNSTTQNPNHVYAAAGQYDVCLSIVTSDTCTSTFCDFVTVVDSVNTNNCMAYFTYSSAGSLSVDFADMSFVNPNAPVISWAWSFGDGTSSMVQNPNHVYTSVGQYEVCLTIVTADTCTSTYCEYIVVTTGGSGNCEALFTSSALPSNPFDIAFVDASTGNGIAYMWDFGDGSFSTDQNPIHSYNAMGTYYVCLSIFTIDSCSSTYCEVITVSQGTVTYEVTGSVWAGSDAVNNGIAILMNSTGGFWSSDIVSGSYLFTTVDAGLYIVYAIPSFIDYPTYAPTYHDTALFWADAIEFTVATSNVSNIDINLIEMAQTITGPGGIFGSIIWPNTIRSTNTYKDRLDNNVGNISLLLLDMDNNLIENVKSNEAGLFEFNHLQYGTYKLHIDLPSYNIYPAIITIDENNPVVDDIIINITDGTFTFSVDELANDSFDGIKLYPNPVNDIVNLEFDIDENVEIVCSVLNSFGQEVFSINEKLGLGHQNLQIDVKSLAEGIYFVTLRQGNKIRTLKFFK